jgi:ectoine hydroxylase-related dioxygenase (phytanoyl-CoA dioxygenase family)
MTTALRLHPIFKEEQLCSEFEQNGYLVLPFLEADEIGRLKAVYRDLHQRDLEPYTNPAYATGLFASTFINDADYRRRVIEAVSPVFERALEVHFKDYKVLSSGFIVKLSHPDSALPPHQDFTMVDEERFTPLTIWCPLEDIDGTSGALCLLKGSHRLPRAIRALTIPSPYRRHAEIIRAHMKPIYVTAGTAIIFTLATFHSSEANTTGQPRVIGSTLVAHRDAELEIAYRSPEQPDRIEMFAQGDDFFVRHTQFSDDVMGRPRIGRHVGSVPYRASEITEQELLRAIDG